MSNEKQEYRSLVDVVAGDVVIWQGKYSCSIDTIVRVTPARIELSGKRIYRKTDGSRYNITHDPFARDEISEATSNKVREIKDEKKRVRVISILEDQCWDDLSTDILVDIISLLGDSLID